MRDDMEGDKADTAEPENTEAPRQLGDILSGMLGDMRRESVEVSALALDIINEHPDLSMSLQSWHVVQTMIEEGIREGRKRQ
jgi:hypothetical protein